MWRNNYRNSGNLELNLKTIVELKFRYKNLGNEMPKCRMNICGSDDDVVVERRQLSTVEMARVVKQITTNNSNNE